MCLDIVTVLGQQVLALLAGHVVRPTSLGIISQHVADIVSQYSMGMLGKQVLALSPCLSVLRPICLGVISVTSCCCAWGSLNCPISVAHWRRRHILVCLIDSWRLSVVLMQPYCVACFYSLKLIRGAEFSTWRLLFSASDLKYQWNWWCETWRLPVTPFLLGTTAEFGRHAVNLFLPLPWWPVTQYLWQWTMRDSWSRNQCCIIIWITMEFVSRLVSLFYWNWKGMEKNMTHNWDDVEW